MKNKETLINNLKNSIPVVENEDDMYHCEFNTNIDSTERGMFGRDIVKQFANITNKDTFRIRGKYDELNHETSNKVLNALDREIVEYSDESRNTTKNIYITNTQTAYSVPVGNRFDENNYDLFQFTNLTRTDMANQFVIYSNYNTVWECSWDDEDENDPLLITYRPGILVNEGYGIIPRIKNDIRTKFVVDSTQADFELIIQAYYNAFSDEAYKDRTCMYVLSDESQVKFGSTLKKINDIKKQYESDFVEMLGQDAQIKRLPQVIVLPNLSIDDKKAVLNSVDCLVDIHPTYDIYYNALHALACNKYVLTSDPKFVKEYDSKFTNGLHKLKYVPSSYSYRYDLDDYVCKYFVPDFNYIISRLRDIVDLKEEGIEQSDEALNVIEEHFNLEDRIEIFIESFKQKRNMNIYTQLDRAEEIKEYISVFENMDDEEIDALTSSQEEVGTLDEFVTESSDS